jgi:hypothetical protein
MPSSLGSIRWLGYEQAIELWSTILAADLRVLKPLLDQFMGSDGRQYTELHCLAVAEAIEQRLGALTPINPVAG